MSPTRHSRRDFVLKALFREAERLRRHIRVLQLHEEGLESDVIAERLELTAEGVNSILRRHGFKPNQDAVYLAEDSRRRKAADR